MSLAANPLYKGKRFSAATAGAAIAIAPSDGFGILGRISISKVAAGATLTIYDALSATGTAIAVVDCNNWGTLILDTIYTVGLFAVIAGGDPDLVISYVGNAPA